MKKWVLGVLVLLTLFAVYLFVFFGHREALPGKPYTLVIQPGVSEASVRLVVTGLEVAEQFLLDATGRTVSETAEVRLSNFTPCSPLEPILLLASTAEVRGNRMCVNTHSGVWKEALGGNSGIAISVVAHGHYHLLQNELGCLPPPWRKEYGWLTEGGASYIGWETAIASGYLSRDWVDALLERIIASAPNLRPLASYERSIGGDATYILAYRAVQQLVRRTDSLASVNDFCIRVGQGEPWREAFVRTFGVTLEDFYAEFESSR